MHVSLDRDANKIKNFNVHIYISLDLGEQGKTIR